jgi:hypothetical protein
MVWYLPIPFYFTKIESTLAVLWCWGYIANGEWFRFNTPIWFLDAYYIMYMLPLMDLCGTLYESNRLCAAQKIEIGLFVLAIGIALVACFIVLIVAGGAMTVFSALSLYIFVAAIVVVLWKSVTDRRRLTSQIEAASDPEP